VAGKIVRNPIVFAAIVILTVMAFLAVFAPWLGTVPPTAVNPLQRLRPPSYEAWMGTDMLGRDLWSRVVYGARVSLLVAALVAVFATAIGFAIGLISGFVRGLDSIVMRLMDGMMSIPALLLAIALMALTRPSIQNVIIAIVVAETPRVARLIRGVVLSLRDQLYVDAAIASGTRTPMIILRHIVPNALAPLIVQGTYIFAAAMTIEAALSFIGAGTPASTPSWGNVMSEGKALFQLQPRFVLIPAVFLSLTILSVNVIGDALRDVIDPRLAGSM
jgi:peptide/nickel transport system permease protein